MKITTVSYQKAFATGPFLQEKIGFEAEIEGGNQTAEGCLSLLKEMAERFHREANPHLYQNNTFPGTDNFKYAPLEKSIPVISKDAEKLEIAIDNATSLESLAEIKEACGKAGLVTQYMKRLNELMTNG